MKPLTLATGLAIAALFSAASFAADIAVGTVLAYDRKAETLVLADRSVWSLAQAKADIPGNLAAGARVQFSYETADDGARNILELNVIRKAPSQGATLTAQGTILAYDREANLLVFEDKSTWSLQGMQAEVPFGLDAGDRIEIEYIPGDDGVALIRKISILLD